MLPPFSHFLLSFFRHPHFIHLSWLKPILLSNCIQVLHIVSLPLFSLSFSLQFLPLFFLSSSWSISLSLVSLPQSLCAHTNIKTTAHTNINIIFLPFSLFLTISFSQTSTVLSFFLAIILSYLSDHPLHAYFPFSSLIGRAPYLSS